jgi:hypothetical protein
MKRLTLGLLIMSFLICLNSEAVAAWWKKEKKETPVQPAKEEEARKEETPKPVEDKNIDREKQKALEKRKQILANKLAMLNNTEWQIELVAASGKEKKQISVIFKDNKVSSTFSPADFPATNFTPTLNDDGTLLWETMQTSEKQGVLFWRTDVSADMASMRGLISHQLPNKTTKDYTFVSTGKVSLSQAP